MGKATWGICRHCKRMFGSDDLCPSCRRCKQNCGCVCILCQPCSKREGRAVTHHQKVFCRQCGFCKRYKGRNPEKFRCSCRKMPAWQATTAPEGRMLLGGQLPRSLGVEIEIAEVGTISRMEPLPPWLHINWVRDGSINGGASGRECVVAPLWGKRFKEGIEILGANFAHHGCGVNETCGYHVHVGPSQKGTEGAFELRRLLDLYTRLEPEVWRLIEPGRDKLRFCKPFSLPRAWFDYLWTLKEERHLRKSLLFWLYGKNIQTWSQNVRRGDTPKPGEFFSLPRLRGHKYEDCRYYGLNLHSWMQRGTIEWRHHEGTILAEEMIGWGHFCGWFTDIAMSLRDEEVREIATLEQFLQGEWKSPYRVVRWPSATREWVAKKLSEPRVEPTEVGIQPTPVRERNYIQELADARLRDARQREALQRREPVGREVGYDLDPIPELEPGYEYDRDDFNDAEPEEE